MDIIHDFDSLLYRLKIMARDTAYYFNPTVGIEMDSKVDVRLKALLR